MKFSVSVYDKEDLQLGESWTVEVPDSPYEPGHLEWISPWTLALREAAKDPHGLIVYGVKVVISIVGA